MSSYHSKTYHLKGIEIMDEGLTLHDNPLKMGKWTLECNSDGDLCIKSDNAVHAKISQTDARGIPEISDNCRFFMVDAIDVDRCKGMIVSNTNRFYNFDLTQGPTTTQSLPTIKLTKDEKDPAILGVIDHCEEYQREYSHGIFRTIYPQEDEINRVVVKTKGPGSVWVVDRGGVLANGDFLASSGIPGYCSRQDQANIHYNFSMGKITHDCNFEPELQILQKPVDFNKDGPIYQPLTNAAGDFIADYEYEKKYVTLEGAETTKIKFEQDLERIEKIMDDEDSVSSQQSDSEGIIRTRALLCHPARKIFRACLVGYI